MIPAEDDWSQSSRCYGGHAECGDICLNSQTLEDLRAITPSDETSVDVQGAYPDEEELLRTAWGVLRRNIDLMWWSLCKAYKDRLDDLVWDNEGFLHLQSEHDRIEAMYHNITAAITGGLFERTGANRINITVHSGNAEDGPLEANFQGWWFPHTIRIGRLNRMWYSRYMRMWTEAPTEEDRYCAVIDLAATLFHELHHVLGGDFTNVDHRQCYDPTEDDGESPCPCDEIYLSENVFRWAIYQRYPEASSSWCCRAAGKETGDPSIDDSDSIYYHDGTLYPAVAACMPEPTGTAGNPWWDEITRGLAAGGSAAGETDLHFWWWEVLKSHVS